MGTSVVKSRIEDSLISAFADVNGVCGVYVVPSSDFVNVFTIIDQDDEQTYAAIYERERSIIRQHSDWHFDFNVITRRGRSVDELVGSAVPVWQRTEAATPCPNVTSI
ncbi:MAG: hypothetical protein ABSH32_05985 [Bryobacteraceae bacterium]|jgi:hypothetical protein